MIDSNRIIAVTGAVVCAVLLAAAVPRLMASLYALYPDSVLQHSQETDRSPSEQVLQQSGMDLQKALAWYDAPSYWRDLAYLHVLREGSSEAPSIESQALLRQARDEMIRGLKLSPADPLAWFRLAIVDDLLASGPRKVLDSLRLSIYAGRLEKDLLLSRLALAFPYLQEADEEMESLIEDQIRLAWAFQAKELVAFAVDQPEFLIWIEGAMMNSPDDWNRFLDYFEKLSERNQPAGTAK